MEPETFGPDDFIELPQSIYQNKKNKAFFIFILWEDHNLDTEVEELNYFDSVKEAQAYIEGAERACEVSGRYAVMNLISPEDFYSNND